MKNKKIFEFLKIIIYILYFISMMLIGGYVAQIWIELEFIDFFLRLLIVMLGAYLVNFISLVWHELGHLVFGIKAKLKFVSFSVFNFIIAKENNKLKMSKTLTLSGVGGYCSMIFDENKSYDKKSIVAFFLGGVIFNIILVIIFSILLAFSNNIYLNISEVLFIITNVYFVLINSVPATTITGINTDMLQIINCFKDPEYINILRRCTNIQNLVKKGYELKDLDEKLFYMPKDFSNSSNVLMAQFYIDYIADKGQYYEAIEHIKNILKNTGNKLSKANINLLKSDLIYYAFKGDFDTQIISEYWNKDIRKYLDAMGGFVPQFIGINYMYSSLIEKDKKNAEKYLKIFNKIKNNHHDKKAIEEIYKIILDVKDRMKEEVE